MPDIDHAIYYGEVVKAFMRGLGHKDVALKDGHQIVIF